MPTSWTTPQTARLAASAGLLLSHGVAAAGFDAANNIALYWGQNSYGQATGDLAQQSLATYCANTNVDIIPMAFAVQLTTGEGGQPVINFANSGNNCSVFTGTGTLDCPGIGDDIKTCQDVYNKTILLSIGGATYSEGGFETEADAIKAADLMWNTFGPVQAADVPGDPSPGNSTDPPPNNITTSLPGPDHNTTTASLSAGQSTTSTICGSGSTETGLLSNITATPGPFVNTTTAQATLATGLTGTGTTGSLTKVTATPAPCNNGIATPGLPTGANNTIGTRTGPVTATLLVNNMTATLVLDSDPCPNGAATPTSSDSISSSITPDALLPDGSTHCSDAALTAGIITSTEPYLSLTAQSYDNTQTYAPAQAPAIDALRAENYTNDDNILVTISITTPTTLQTITRASIAAVPTQSAETLNYDTTHPQFKRQSLTLRPFGTAGVDGFDLDLESLTTNFPTFANRLRDLMDTATKVSETNRPFYLTTAPQCPYPDIATNPLLNGGVHFDAVFIQFYNNYCGVQSFTPNTSTQQNFNFETWDTWAKSGSANPDVKIFLGVPAGVTAAGSGYLPPTELEPVIEYTKTFSSFGGVMAWDASQAWANQGFLERVKEALDTPVTMPTVPSSTSVVPVATPSAPMKKRRGVRRGLRGEWRPRCRGVECIQ